MYYNIAVKTKHLCLSYCQNGGWLVGREAAYAEGCPGLSAGRDRELADDRVRRIASLPPIYEHFPHAKIDLLPAGTRATYI